MQLTLSLETDNSLTILPFLRRIFKLLKVKKSAALTQVLIEAFNNAVIHGNKRNAKKKITVIIKLNHSHVVIYVKDEGKGFRLTDKKISKWQTNGRGIPLIKAYANSVRNFNTRKHHILEIRCKLGK